MDKAQETLAAMIATAIVLSLQAQRKAQEDAQEPEQISPQEEAERISEWDRMERSHSLPFPTLPLSVALGQPERAKRLQQARGREHGNKVALGRAVSFLDGRPWIVAKWDWECCGSKGRKCKCGTGRLSAETLRKLYWDKRNCGCKDLAGKPIRQMHSSSVCPNAVMYVPPGLGGKPRKAQLEVLGQFEDGETICEVRQGRRVDAKYVAAYTKSIRGKGLKYKPRKKSKEEQEALDLVEPTFRPSGAMIPQKIDQQAMLDTETLSFMARDKRSIVTPHWEGDKGSFSEIPWEPLRKNF